MQEQQVDAEVFGWSFWHVVFALGRVLASELDRVPKEKHS